MFTIFTVYFILMIESFNLLSNIWISLNTEELYQTISNMFISSQPYSHYMLVGCKNPNKQSFSLSIIMQSVTFDNCIPSNQSNHFNYTCYVGFKLIYYNFTVHMGAVISIWQNTISVFCIPWDFGLCTFTSYPFLFFNICKL